MEVIIVLVLLGLVAAIGLTVVRAHRRSRTERTAAMGRMAQRRGWAFQPKPPLSTVPQMERFELFKQGRNRTMTNLMAGDHEDFRIAVFDYSYVTGGGNSQTTWRQTVVSVHSRTLELPSFSLRPENTFHRIAALFGAQDIDLDERPEFSRRYLLRGVDESAVRTAFSPSVADYLEVRDRCCAAGDGPILFFWRPGKLTPPEQIDEKVAEAEGLALRFMRAAAERPRST